MNFLGNYEVAELIGLTLILLFTGVVAGLIAGMLGVGGGIVIVPVLYHFFTVLSIDPSVRMHLAIGTSLATIIPTSIVSARSHYRRGGLDTSLLKSIGPAVFIGASLAGAIGGLLQATFLSAIFASVALAVSINMAFRTEGSAFAQQLPGRFGRSVIGVTIGGLSAIMGIGGGTLGVPILSAFNTPIRRAVGTASGFGLLIGVPGTIGFILAGLGVPDRPSGSLGFINIIGFALLVPLTMRMAPVGADIAHRINPNHLRLAFATFLAVTAGKMFIDLLG